MLQIIYGELLKDYKGQAQIMQIGLWIDVNLLINKQFIIIG